MRAIAPLALGLLLGCGAPSTRDVRVTILDADGRPVPGALFYAEAYDHAGGFAFVAGVAGDAGEVPDSAREPLKLAWRGNARVAMVAFAPGYHPAIRRDPAGRVESDGAVLVLTSIEEPRPAGPGLGGFAATGLLGPEHEALRAAFAAAISE